VENSVTALGQLLGLEPEVVKGALEDDSLVSRINDFKENNRIQKKADFEKFETNLRKETEDAYYQKLINDAKSGDLNGDLYKTIKGMALQMTEKDLAKRYGVENYKNLQDVIDQVKQSSGGTDDEKVKDLTDKINELKEANLKLEKKAEDAVSEEKRKYKTRFLETELSQAVGTLPFDFDGLGAEEKQAAQNTTKEIISSVFATRYKLGTDDDYSAVTVSDKNGDVVKSEATREPVPVTDVLVKLAKELNMKLKSPEKGGQGGSSSQSSTSTSFASEADLNDAIAAGKIDPYSKEALEARRKFIYASKG